jgi:hypothetical protein
MIRKFLLAVPLAVVPMKAFADDYIPPQLVKVSTPIYRPASEGFAPPMGTYNYTVSWEGISAAECSVTISEVDDKYVIEAAARTYSGIDLLYKLRYTAKGVLAQADLSPVSLEIDHRENSKRKNVEMSFAPNSGEIKAVRGNGDANGEKKMVSFVPHNLTLDPIGAAFLARSLEWKVGDTKNFDVFNGKTRYLISLTAVDRTTIEQRGVQKDVFVISPKVRNLTSTKPESKLREALIYMTADKQRDIVRIVSSVFIGSVTTELDSFVPSMHEPSLIRVAHAQKDAATR